MLTKKKESTQAPSNQKSQSQSTPPNPVQTRITIKYNAGFKNDLYIRGEGANLRWDKGQKCVNVAPDKWTWETNTPFQKCEFKVLINDITFEKGENHILHAGHPIDYTPQF